MKEDSSAHTNSQNEILRHKDLPSKIEPESKDSKFEVKSTKEEGADKAFTYIRYQTFAGIWLHHNATQLQWPAVVIGAALLVIFNVAPADINQIWDWRLWGRDIKSAIKVGLPITVIGLGILPLLYSMGRSRASMMNMEEELNSIERDLGVTEKNFSQLNHPPGLPSGILMRRCLMVLAVSMIIFGVLFSLGVKIGAIILSSSILVGIIVLLGKRRRRISH